MKLSELKSIIRSVIEESKLVEELEWEGLEVGDPVIFFTKDLSDYDLELIDEDPDYIGSFDKMTATIIGAKDGVYDIDFGDGNILYNVMDYLILDANQIPE